MQIYVDPAHPAEALEHVQCQMKMLTCLLSQGGKEGIDLDDESLTGMCELLRACSGAVAEVAEMMQHVSSAGTR